MLGRQRSCQGHIGSCWLRLSPLALKHKKFHLLMAKPILKHPTELKEQNRTCLSVYQCYWRWIIWLSTNDYSIYINIFSRFLFHICLHFCNIFMQLTFRCRVLYVRVNHWWKKENYLQLYTICDCGDLPRRLTLCSSSSSILLNTVFMSSLNFCNIILITVYIYWLFDVVLRQSIGCYILVVPLFAHRGSNL